MDTLAEVQVTNENFTKREPELLARADQVAKLLEQMNTLNN
jgi:hypothetical protein